MIYNNLISFESTREGAGKTTMIQLVQEALSMLQLEHSMYKFPHSWLRDWVLGSMTDAKAHLLTQNAQFIQTMHDNILPDLVEGKIVLLDRWTDSSLAYQGYGSELDLDFAKQLIKFGTSKCVPRTTILLDLDSSIAKKRVETRGSVVRVAQARGDEFASRVREGFLEIAQENPDRVKIVDASGSEGQVFTAITNILPWFNYGKKD